MSTVVVLSADELRELIRDAVTDALRSSAPERPAPVGLVDQAGIADALGVSTRQIRRMVAEGLPEVRVGDAPRYEVRECLEWLRDRRRA